VQSQMIFDLGRLQAFLSAAEDTLADVRFYASVALLRSTHMAERACALPGVAIPQRALAQISRGGGIDLARELAAGVAGISRVDALHVFPLGAEAATREVAAEFRVARGVSAQRPAGRSVTGTAPATGAQHSRHHRAGDQERAGCLGLQHIAKAVGRHLPKWLRLGS